MGRMANGHKCYSANSSDYKLLEEIGHGASATVYRAIYLPLNDIVAIKCLDLDRCNSNLNDIQKEAQTMSLIDHPNVVRAYCSFVVDRNLWVAMPFMSEGSCLHLMKIAYSDGFSESVIGSILKETLKALEYLHQHGHIHRDVKAGNILLDCNGAVKLGDFGVSACMFDNGDRKRSRNTFVGTPCWMAPEVLQPVKGYDFKADIWSFGITALELAHGHAPFSKYSPMKVLLMTIQNAPPGLDYDRDKKFSKSFKEMVAMCLVKDQTKRPTAAKLLKHSFFRHAKPAELSLKKIFADLPPLWNRVKAIQLKDAAQLALKKMPSAEEEALSQSEYKRGVSAWVFDIEDLKIQASTIHDDDEIQEVREDEIINHFVNNKDALDSRYNLGKSVSPRGQENGEVPALAMCSSEKGKLLESDSVESFGSQEKGKLPESDLESRSSREKNDVEKDGASTSLVLSTSDKEMILTNPNTETPMNHKSRSGPLMRGNNLSHSFSERGRMSERCENGVLPLSFKANREFARPPSFSGPLMLPNRASANSLSAPIKLSGGFKDSLEDKARANVVQIKGRFSVTSENVDSVKENPICTIPSVSAQVGSLLKKSASVGDWVFDSKQTSVSSPVKEFSDSISAASYLTPQLQNLSFVTALQQDLILNLLNSLRQAQEAEAFQNGKFCPLPRSSESNGGVETAASERECLLHSKILELEARMANMTEELTAERLKYVQLQQQLTAVSGHERKDAAA